MSVRIQLHRQGTPFTNLDEVSGRVILNLVTAEKIQFVVVKLEGESRTRLQGPRREGNDQGNSGTELEYHKVGRIYEPAVEEEMLMQVPKAIVQGSRSVSFDATQGTNEEYDRLFLGKGTT
jgi:hypothetical protein